MGRKQHNVNDNASHKVRFYNVNVNDNVTRGGLC